MKSNQFHLSYSQYCLQLSLAGQVGVVRPSPAPRPASWSAPPPTPLSRVRVPPAQQSGGAGQGAVGVEHPPARSVPRPPATRPRPAQLVTEGTAGGGTGGGAGHCGRGRLGALHSKGG